MAEQRWITLSFEDKEYELGFTKATVRMAESLGFSMANLQNQSKLITGISILFQASFLAKHPNIRETVVERIWEDLDKKTELVQELISMFSDTVDQIMANGKNAEWSIKTKQ